LEKEEERAANLENKTWGRFYREEKEERLPSLSWKRRRICGRLGEGTGFGSGEEEEIGKEIGFDFLKLERERGFFF